MQISAPNRICKIFDTSSLLLHIYINTCSQSYICFIISKYTFLWCYTSIQGLINERNDASERMKCIKLGPKWSSQHFICFVSLPPPLATQVARRKAASCMICHALCTLNNQFEWNWRKSHKTFRYIFLDKFKNAQCRHIPLPKHILMQ